MPNHDGARLGACASGRLAAIVMALLAPPGLGWTQVLTLPEALGRAAADPARPATQARVEAAEAGVRQAGVKPAPSIGLEVEDFAGTGRRELLDEAQATLFYERTLERGGKREARVAAARAEVPLAELQGQVRTLDRLAEAQALWVEAATARLQIPVAEERLAVARRLETETARRVAAARDPLFAGERARTAVVQATIALDQAKAAAEAADAALAAFLGAAPAPADSASLTVLDPGPATPIETPDLRLLEARRDAAAARIRVEETRAVRDPTLRAGLRAYQAGDDVALVVGGSIPLNRRDANRGAIERARAERQAAELDIGLARAERDREVARLAARRAAAAREVERIEDEVLPSATRAVDLVLDGFRRGGGAFTFLEVAEAQRALIEARARRVELLKSFHIDGARLDRLTGRHAALLEPRQ